MKELQRFIQRTATTSSLPPLLPLMHSTSCSVTEDVLRQDELSATKCPVFHEDLLYLFYGKPSYKVSSKVNASLTTSLFSPCCFIIDPNKVNVKRIFPFDTGAYSDDRYKNLIPHNIELEDFQLQPNIKSIPEFIKLFYTNNSNYLSGKCNISEDRLVNKVTISLGELLSASGVVAFDDRARTVEISSDSDIILSDAILAIIIPAPFRSNEYFKAFIKAHPKVEVIPYFIHYPQDPIMQNEAVYQAAMGYLSRKGGIK